MLNTYQGIDFHALVGERIGEDLRDRGLLNVAPGSEMVTFTDPYPPGSPESVEPVSYTWEELGLDPDSFVTRNWSSREILLLGHGGTTVSSLPIAAAAAGGDFLQSARLGDGFVLAGQRDLLVSADGITWDPGIGPTIDGPIVGLSAAGADEVVLVIDHNSSTLVARGDPRAGVWDVLELPIDRATTVRVLSATSDGHEGVALALNVGPVPVGGVVSVEDDGHRLTLDSDSLLFSLTRLDDGAMIWEGLDLVQLSPPERMRIDESAGVIDILDPATGELIARFGYDDVMDMIGQVANGTEGRTVMVWSPGGDRWSVAPGADELSYRSMPFQLALLPDRLIAGPVLDPTTYATTGLATWTLP